jgi:hypothetical protein
MVSTFAKTYSSDTIGGVQFAPYSTERLERLPVGTLLICVGTLVCFSSQELTVLVKMMNRKSLSIAFFEPAPVYARCSWRRQGIYHDYSAAFAGFEDQLERKWPYLGSPELERWTYGFYSPAT